MSSVAWPGRIWQTTRPQHPSSYTFRYAATLTLVLGLMSAAIAAEPPPPTPNPQAYADSPAAMKPYTEPIPGVAAKFDMVPIPAGKYRMGSPANEENRNDDEGPVHEVEVDAFWMGRHEVTWDEYEIYVFNLDIQRRETGGRKPSNREKLADAVTRPTRPYTDMTFGMGTEGYPAICMTQRAAKGYCQWLSAKTGRYYRLPTEAEWEYACRAGTTTAYHFGNDPAELEEYAWSYDNSNDGYHKVGLKKPNPWGLYDIHGNVAEWVLDQYRPDFYGKAAPGLKAHEILAVPTELYPRAVRGGSWDDDPEALRSAARRGSEKAWKDQDPQIPQSKWYHTDALFVGFRVVRPLVEPSDELKAQYQAAGTDEP